MISNSQFLPGDSSPPSRFVRLFYLRGYALQSRAMTSFQEAVVLGTGLLNNVFLPVGPVAGNPREPGDGPELTDYGVLKSCQEKVMLIRGYVNSQWRKIDLKRGLAELVPLVVPRWWCFLKTGAVDANKNREEPLTTIVFIV